MHELSIVVGILDEVGEEACSQAAQQVTVVRLKVGALSGVVPSALEFSWDLAAAGTVAAGSALRIQRIRVAVPCANCGVETEPAAGTGMRCSAFGSDTHVVVVSKVDLAQAVDFDREAALGAIRQVHGGVTILELSSRTGAGFEAWLELIEERVRAKGKTPVGA